MSDLEALAEEGIPARIEGEPLAGKHILIVVENLPLPFDRRVWQEARTLKAAGADVSIICPKGKGFESSYEEIGGIAIHRHPLPLEAKGALGFLLEYGAALFWETWLAWIIFLRRRFDVIQGCNPPDLIFLVALPFKLLGVKYIFDHHDINPELYEAKFDKRGFFWNLMRLFEKITFRVADVSIATNQSYREIAIKRGGMSPEKVHVVRSGPDLSKLKRVEPVAHWKNGREHMVGYVGVMGEQEGIDLLIEAVEHLVHEMQRDDIQFVLVGGGPALDQLKSITSAKGLEDYIVFTGRAPDETLFEVLSTMDLGVNPDRVNVMNDKSTMNKIMEYMAPKCNGLSAQKSGNARGGFSGALAPYAIWSGRSTMKQAAWILALALIGAVTAAFQLDRQSRYTSDLAEIVPKPARYFAQAHIAVEAVNGSDDRAALSAARTLLEKRPVPAENVRLYAQAQLKAGETRQGLYALQIAARRGWRDRVTQQMAAQIAWAAGDAAASANRLAALYALSPDDPVLDELARSVLADPAGQEQMASILAGPARWERRFVRHGRHDMNYATFNAIMLSAHAKGARFSCGPLRDAIGRQARDTNTPAENNPLAPLLDKSC